MSLADDAAAMLSDFGVAVCCAEFETRGVLNQTRVNESDASGKVRQVHRRLLMVTRGAIGVPARDSAITIDGRAFRVTDRAGDQGEVDDLHEFWEVMGA